MYIKKVSIPFVYFMIISLCACNNRLKSDANFINKTITLHLDQMNHLDSLLFVRDSTALKSMQYKFIVYYDSTACPSCVISHIGSWHRFVYYQERPMVDYIFILHPKKDEMKDWLAQCKGARWHYNLYLDTLGVYERDNNDIVVQNKVNMVMVNNCGKVIYVGNPTKNLDSQKKLEVILDSISKIKDV